MIFFPQQLIIMSIEKEIEVFPMQRPLHALINASKKMHGVL